MHKFICMFYEPADRAHFRKHYEEVHMKLPPVPGLKNVRRSFDVAGRDTARPDGTANIFLYVEGEFDSEADYRAANDSPEGQAALADSRNFATGGVKVLHFDLPPA